MENRMNTRNKAIAAFSLVGSLVVAAQIGAILLAGAAVCLNEGCRVVESLTKIAPLSFNLLGLLYFQTLFWITFLSSRRRGDMSSLAQLLLLAGLAAEGVLLAYQIFVAASFCSYCLVLLTLVFAMNYAAGPKQLLAGLAAFTGIISISSLLSYGPAVLLAKEQNLSAGTFGTKACANPAKELFLFFSADCPHCHQVIAALENCNSCDFHFNPVEEIDAAELSGVQPANVYEPEVNRLFLKLLGIDTIPVLLEKTTDGYALIRGEQRIISYIRQACYRDQSLFYQDPDSTARENGMSVFGEEDECSVTVECEDEK